MVNRWQGEGKMDKMKRVFRWFWAWQDEQEEAWLRDMTQQGWHLVDPGLFGFYTFERGVPGNVVYRLDFKTADKDMDDYLQLFADAGWEHVGAMGGWQYFRKEVAEGENPEIYTDAASKIQKYQRLMLFLIIFLPIYSTLLNNTQDAASPFVRVIGVIFALFMLLYVYAMVRLLIRIQELKTRT